MDENLEKVTRKLLSDGTPFSDLLSKIANIDALGEDAEDTPDGSSVVAVSRICSVITKSLATTMLEITAKRDLAMEQGNLQEAARLTIFGAGAHRLGLVVLGDLQKVVAEIAIEEGADPAAMMGIINEADEER